VAKRAVQCSNCDTKYVFRLDNQGEPILDLRTEIPETISCPSCEKTNEVKLDNVPGASILHNCEECGSVLRISRTISDISIKIHEQDYGPIDDAFIQEVCDALPDQPWPKGIHSDVAKRLGTSGSKVQKAISALIKAGTVKPQVDGVVIEGPSSDQATEE
jgi:hypothetical protein